MHGHITQSVRALFHGENGPSKMIEAGARPVTKALRCHTPSPTVVLIVGDELHGSLHAGVAIRIVHAVMATV